jgi:hypothetical protein
MGTDSTQILMSENVSLQIERVVPIGSGVVSLVQVLDEATRAVADPEANLIAVR